MNKENILASIYKDINELLEIERSTHHLMLSRPVNLNFSITNSSISQSLRYEFEQLKLNNDIDINQIPVASHKKVIGRIITLIKRPAN